MGGEGWGNVQWLYFYPESNQMQRQIVILGTGGTIAGVAASVDDDLNYTAAQIGVDQLVAAVPGLRAFDLHCEQVAQIDSKDMSHAIWQALAQRVAHHAARADVAAIVVTHGTDTLEETAYFVQRVLAPTLPVVFTAAMRPASSAQADGPGNLLAAVRVAQSGAVTGVSVVMAGAVFAAAEVRKLHSQRLDAFGADTGPLARVDDSVSVERQTATQPALGLARVARDPSAWPRVEIVTNHASADGRIVDALLAQGVDGLIAAGTGNGSLSVGLEAALRRAQSQGVRVLRASRCALGRVASTEGSLPGCGTLSAPQARVELLLDLMAD